jgi:dihydrofolate reductase
MPKLRVHNLAVSLDGYAAGPEQSVQNPLGVDGTRLHEWVFATRSGNAMLGVAGGPIRGRWGDETWDGWWGDTPPYHHPVFVLTHHPRPTLEMAGGTTFHFVDGGIEEALERAFWVADGADVRIGGGPATIQQYLRAGLVDELHMAIVPILLGDGERLFDDLGDATGRYECVEMVSSPAVTHVRLASTPA